MAATIKKHEMLANENTLKKLFEDINVLDIDSCWVWKKAKVKDGYGKLTTKIKSKSYTIFAHRLSWYVQYGEIPNDMIIDHTCHNPKECAGGKDCSHRACINPSHLSLVTYKENIAKGGTVNLNRGMCKNNIHEWVDDNIKIWASGKKVCLPCHQATTKRNAKVGK